MFGTIYIRAIVGIIAIAGMVCYLGTSQGLVEPIAAIVSIIYIDHKLSNENK